MDEELLELHVEATVVHLPLARCVPNGTRFTVRNMLGEPVRVVACSGDGIGGCGSALLLRYDGDSVCLMHDGHGNWTIKRSWKRHLVVAAFAAAAFFAGLAAALW